MPLSGKCFISSTLSRFWWYARSMDNASRQVLFEHIIFPLIFISTIQQIFCLSPLLLCVFDVKSFLFKYRLNNLTFLLDYRHTVPLKCPPRSEIRLYHLVVYERSSLCTTCVQTISCFLQLRVVSPHENTYLFGSLLTNKNLPHPQKASRNDFHGLLGQALPLPSRVFLARPALSCFHYFKAQVMFLLKLVTKKPAFH